MKIRATVESVANDDLALQVTVLGAAVKGHAGYVVDLGLRHSFQVPLSKTNKRAFYVGREVESRLCRNDGRFRIPVGMAARLPARDATGSRPLSCLSG